MEPPGKRFQRRIEDFECCRCGQAVTGSGYTNHCPRCLWSRHVDVQPGDRQEACGGEMEPVAVETRAAQHWLLHRCTRCGAERRVRAHPDDDFERLLEVARRATER